MNEKRYPITLRVTLSEKLEIARRAKEAQTSVNEYVKKRILEPYPSALDGSLRVDMMRSLSLLENTMISEDSGTDCDKLREIVTNWTGKVLLRLENP